MSPPAGSGMGVGLVGLAAAVEVPESASSQPPSLSVGLGERDDASLLPLRDVCLCCCCWLPEVVSYVRNVLQKENYYQ